MDGGGGTGREMKKTEQNTFRRGQSTREVRLCRVPCTCTRNEEGAPTSGFLLTEGDKNGYPRQQRVPTSPVQETETAAAAAAAVASAELPATHIPCTFLTCLVLRKSCNLRRKSWSCSGSGLPGDDGNTNAFFETSQAGHVTFRTASPWDIRERRRGKEEA